MRVVVIFYDLWCREITLEAQPAAAHSAPCQARIHHSGTPQLPLRSISLSYSHSPSLRLLPRLKVEASSRDHRTTSQEGSSLQDRSWLRIPHEKRNRRRGCWRFDLVSRMGTRMRTIGRMGWKWKRTRKPRWYRKLKMTGVDRMPRLYQMRLVSSVRA